jgi:hypothetical protein
MKSTAYFFNGRMLILPICPEHTLGRSSRLMLLALANEVNE